LNFKRLFLIDKSKLTFAGIIFISSAIAITWIELAKPKIERSEDLYFIKGHFRDYDFDNHGGRYTNYTFRLKKFSNSFKIKADFLGGFEKSKFVNLQYGDDLTISIAPKDIHNLNTNNSYFFVFSIASDQAIFLDTEYTIKKHNSNFIYYAAISFLLVGLISLYYGLKWQQSRRRLKIENSTLEE
jgi:hypothetical protein